MPMGRVHQAFKAFDSLEREETEKGVQTQSPKSKSQTKSLRYVPYVAGLGYLKLEEHPSRTRTGLRGFRASACHLSILELGELGELGDFGPARPVECKKAEAETSAGSADSFPEDEKALQDFNREPSWEGPVETLILAKEEARGPRGPRGPSGLGRLLERAEGQLLLLRTACYRRRDLGSSRRGPGPSGRRERLRD